MKTITKGEQPDRLRIAKEKGWNWDEFHSNDQAGYRACREQGLHEQGYECAYTGIWLGPGSRQSIHIDHFRKKSIYGELTFEWDNLFVATKDIDCGADFKDRRVTGPRNNADRIYAGILSPLDANINKYFWYRQDGMVIPHDEIEDEGVLSKVKRTIDIFNLNSPDLRNRRAGIIQMMRGLRGLDEDELRTFLHSLGFSFVIDMELAEMA